MFFDLGISAEKSAPWVFVEINCLQFCVAKQRRKKPGVKPGKADASGRSDYTLRENDQQKIDIKTSLWRRGCNAPRFHRSLREYRRRYVGR